MKKIKVLHRKLGRAGGPKYKIDGFAHIEKRLIELDTRLKGRAHLLTLIHEVMHIQNPEWSETKVIEKSREMTEVV